MSTGQGLGQRRGADRVDTATGWARLLPGPPLIAPARSFVFPLAVPGEEDALARGALWVEAHPAAMAGFVAQCALGFATAGVAQGLWSLGDQPLAVAGGYAYLLDLEKPARTALLPLRPVVDVLAEPQAGRAILVGYHAVLVLERDSQWQSGRLSWEGVTLTSCEGDVLRGMGWDMRTDEELPFILNLRTRELQGGGYRVDSPADLS